MGTRTFRNSIFNRFFVNFNTSIWVGLHTEIEVPRFRTCFFNILSNIFTLT